MIELENGCDPDTVLMDIREFREAGYLQEVNRLFFHPLGLALEVIVDTETGDEQIVGIIDGRDDPEGYIFDAVDREKALRISGQMVTRKATRMRRLGFDVQPV